MELFVVQEKIIASEIYKISIETYNELLNNNEDKTTLINLKAYCFYIIIHYFIISIYDFFSDSHIVCNRLLNSTYNFVFNKNEDIFKKNVKLYELLLDYYENQKSIDIVIDKICDELDIDRTISYDIFYYKRLYFLNIIRQLKIKNQINII